MSDLTRLIESSRNSRTRALLQAGARDAPSRGAAERVLLALATSTTAAATAKTAAAATVASAGGAATGGTGAAAGGAGGGLAATTLKWLAVGAVSGSLVSAGAIAVQSSGEPPRPQPSVVPRAVVKTTPPEARAAAPLAGEAPAPVVPEVPAAEPSSTAPGTVGGERGRPPGAGDPSHQGKLEREVRWIDAARRALAAGDSTRALAELDHYDRLVETRILDREATVLRIEALLQRGDVHRARRLFDGYVAQYPGDAHIARLRAHWGSIRE